MQTIGMCRHLPGLGFRFLFRPLILSSTRPGQECNANNANQAVLHMMYLKVGHLPAMVRVSPPRATSDLKRYRTESRSGRPNRLERSWGCVGGCLKVAWGSHEGRIGVALR